jgi:hypothetical protein
MKGAFSTLRLRAKLPAALTQDHAKEARRYRTPVTPRAIHTRHRRDLADRFGRFHSVSSRGNSYDSAAHAANLCETDQL